MNGVEKEEERCGRGKAVQGSQPRNQERHEKCSKDELN